MNSFSLFENSLCLPCGEFKGSWSVPCEKTIGIKGANGVGKSSLFRHFQERRESLFKDACSFQGQKSFAPLVNLKVSSVFDLLNKELGNSFKEKFHAKHWLVEAFNFNKLLESWVLDLSGGENQVLKIMIALNYRANIYFFDEPLMNLSDENKKIFEKELINLQKERKSIFLIEHDFSF